MSKKFDVFLNAQFKMTFELEEYDSNHPNISVSKILGEDWHDRLHNEIKANRYVICGCEIYNEQGLRIY